MAANSTTRFSNRVEDYVKYRPDYPIEIIDMLQDSYGLSAGQLIADIGAGTGISAELFLHAGYRVIAVEPNQEMRDKSIELLGHMPGFKAYSGTAENTSLATASVDAVIAGQAFHWFDPEKARAEFSRIIKPGGLVVLLWNERKTSSAFEIAYDELIVRHARDYVQVDHRNIGTANIAGFFSPAQVRLEVFANRQEFDFEGLKGRLLSSSYMPVSNEQGYPEMLKDLQDLFDTYQQDGKILIHYDTKVYAGRLTEEQTK